LDELTALANMDEQSRQALIEQLAQEPAIRQLIAGTAQPVVAAQEEFPQSIEGEGIAMFSDDAGAEQAQCKSPSIMPGGNTIVNFHGFQPFAPVGGFDVTGAGANVNGAPDMNLFPFTFEGERGYAFCLERGLPAPDGPSGNVSIAQALPAESPAVRRAIAFIVGNVPAPLTDDPEGLAHFWAMLGQDCGGHWEAQAVAQMAVWTFAGGSIRGGFQFTANNACLMAAYNTLMDMALAYGEGNLECTGSAEEAGSGCGGSGGGSDGGESGCSSCCCGSRNVIPFGCQIGRIICCNTNRRPANASDEFLIFVGCPNDLREHCGRVLIGPFRLAASDGGTPEITLTPCNCCSGNITFDIVDHCGRPTTPDICNEFYISFRPPSPNFCFELCAELEVVRTEVYFFLVPGGVYQNMALPLRRRIRVRTCISVCIEITPPPPPPPVLIPPPPPGDITVNNNNNNNNDNNANSSNNNSTMQTLMETLLLSSVLGNPPSAAPQPGPQLIPVPQPFPVPQPVPVPQPYPVEQPVPVPVPVEHPVHVPYPEPVPVPMPVPEPCFVPPPDIFICQPPCCAPRASDFAPPGSW